MHSALQGTLHQLFHSSCCTLVLLLPAPCLEAASTLPNTGTHSHWLANSKCHFRIAFEAIELVRLDVKSHQAPFPQSRSGQCRPRPSTNYAASTFTTEVLALCKVSRFISPPWTPLFAHRCHRAIGGSWTEPPRPYGCGCSCRHGRRSGLALTHWYFVNLDLARRHVIMSCKALAAAADMLTRRHRAPISRGWQQCYGHRPRMC